MTIGLLASRVVPRGWAVWRHPPRVRLLVVTVELVAVVLLAAGLVRSSADPPTSDDWMLSGLLAAAAVLQAEVSRRAERRRGEIADDRNVDLCSVWTFAAAWLLPPLLAATTAVSIYVVLYLRVFRPAGVPPHRQIYSLSTVVIAVHMVATVRAVSGAAGQGTASPHGVLGLVLGVLAYAAANIVLVAAVVRLAQPGTGSGSVRPRGDLALELATLSLGAIVVAAVEVPDAWLLLVLLLPPLLLLERTRVIRQLENRALVDVKTGLLNADAWRARARQASALAERESSGVGVLVMDLDHFKKINDRHGHLVGDAVLRAVAEVVSAEIRDGDVAGRFGGDEYVVLVGNLCQDRVQDAVRDIGERIRRRVGTLRVEVPAHTAPTVVERLSVSVGAAVRVGAGAEVETLLALADDALYEAKRAGRNRVRVRAGPPSSGRGPGPGRPRG